MFDDWCQMTWSQRIVASGCAGILLTAAWAATRDQPMPFRVYRSMEAYDDVELPADFNEHTDFVFARLMYPPHPNARFSRGYGSRGRCCEK